MKKFFFTAIFTVFVLSISLNAQKYDFFKDAHLFSNPRDHNTDFRLHHYNVGFYFLDLEFTNSNRFLNGNVKIYLNINTEYDGELVFDFASDMEIDSVKVNNQIQLYSHEDDLIVIEYNHTEAYNDDYDVCAKVYYNGSPSSGVFSRVFWYSGAFKRFTYSLSQPYNAKYWFPCKQVLSDKADSSYFYLTVDKDLKAGSNGILANVTEIDDERKRMEWQSSYPINYYLISFAVGDYQDYSFEVELENFDETVLVQNYIPNRPNYLPDNKDDIDAIADMLILLSDLWGIYPHHEEKYGHCIVPLPGGMEHQTMATQGYFDFWLMMHELAHSWFGNYVTCKTWQDIWINEGFASYGEYLGYQYIIGEGTETQWLLDAQESAKIPDGSVYVPFEELDNVGRIFNMGLSYKKGACLVHMIRYLIDDDDLFFLTKRNFLEQYANSTATGEDFREVLEETTGICFENFFNEWYYGEGYPIYDVQWSQTDNTLHIESYQSTSSPNTELFTIPIEYKIIYSDETYEIIRLEHNQNFETYQIDVQDDVINVIPNPNNYVLADFTTPVEIKESQRNSFKLYPNPSSGIFYVYTKENQEYYYELYDKSGKLISSSMFFGDKSKFNYSHLNSGVYFLKLKNNAFVSIEKLIIVN